MSHQIVYALSAHLTFQWKESRNLELQTNIALLVRTFESLSLKMAFTAELMLMWAQLASAKSAMLMTVKGPAKVREQR